MLRRKRDYLAPSATGHRKVTFRKHESRPEIIETVSGVKYRERFFEILTMSR